MALWALLTHLLTFWVDFLPLLASSLADLTTRRHFLPSDSTEAVLELQRVRVRRLRRADRASEGGEDIRISVESITLIGSEANDSVTILLLAEEGRVLSNNLPD